MEQYFDVQQITTIVLSYLPKVVGAILTIVIGFWIARIMGSLVAQALSKNHVDLGVQKFLSSLLSSGVKIMTLLAAASMFGIETTSFVAIVSALAFSVGLALQGSLGHFASGVLLLVFKPFRTGDLVEIGGGRTGTVAEIQIFNTILETLDNKRVIVPNGLITSNIITNISGQGIIGVEMAFQIGHSNNIEQVRQIICEVAAACPLVLKSPETTVHVGEFNQDMIKLVTRPFCKSEHYWDTLYHLNEAVKVAFDKAGVQPNTPDMNVHIKTQA